LRAGWRVRLAATLLFALAACAAGGATAADYPARPVRLVVGFAAGGPTDILTHILAERLSQRTGQQFSREPVTGPGDMMKFQLYQIDSPVILGAVSGFG
jgi:tripartite-type tricarboxylate transporter receptor subunit TctC